MNQLQPFIGVQEARIPFIRFEQRPVEKRTGDGRITYEDVDYALVTAQGSKDTTEKVVAEWFPLIRVQARDGMYPPGWVPRFEEMYKIWKETREDPVVGTPIKNWPAVSPAECKILLNAGVRSIEDLAEANEEFLGRIGMGARRLKQLAVDWNQANKSQAPLVAQLDATRGSIETLQQTVNGLLEANAQLRADLAAQQRRGDPQGVALPSPESRLADLKDNSDSDEADALNDILKD